jgi:hypothetical protein
MKIILTSLALALVGSYGVAVFFGDILGPAGCFAISLLLGLSSRTITEKLLGYTLYEELSGKRN